MSLLNKILKWSQAELKEWQQDALRRLFAAPKRQLAQWDLDELYTLLKASQGLPNPLGMSSVPLAAEHLPTNPAATEPVLLKSMHTKHLPAALTDL